MQNNGLSRFRSLIALFLILAMVTSFVGCKPTEPPRNEEELLVESADDAIAQLSDVQEDYGYENALSELTEKSTATIDGDSYYRLQQNYQGIPVYGRTVVCATDEDGNVTSLTGNALDIDPNINLTPSITSEQALESIHAYVAETLGQTDAGITISEPITCIYNRSKLAFVYTITMNGRFFESHEVLVDAHDAGILEWNTYIPSFDTNQAVLEVAEVDCESDDSHTLKLVDTRRNHSIYYLDLKTSQLYPTVEDIISNSAFVATVSADQAASDETYTLAHLAQISDFYKDVLGRQSYNNHGSPVYLFSCNADYLTDQGYALASPTLGVIMLGAPVNRFTEHLGKATDLVAHEYAHMVFQTEVGLSKDLDVTSVNEGIADIFGNLIELYVEGNQDPSWPLAEDAGYIKYHMAEPTTMDSYGNEEHLNAHILSHSAYLMWNGIDGDDSKKLTVQQLAKLWYRAVLMMPSDCDFNGCRRLVELAASSMELTTDQIACIGEAFDAVGITGTTTASSYAVYDLALDGTLSVYGGNKELYDNYTLNITGNTAVYGPVIEKIDTSYNRTNTITKADPYPLNLPQGIYVFTITDNANPSATSTFTVCVQSNDGDANIDIFTNFGCTPVKGTVSEIKEVDGKETNVPVTNAVVKVYSQAQESVIRTIDMSETEGFFEVDLPVGYYSITVEAEGYISSTTSFELTAEKPQYLEFVLEANTALVTDVYAKDCTYTANLYNYDTGESEDTEVTVSYRIPKILLPGNAVEQINAEIYNTLYPIIEISVTEIEEYGFPYTSEEISYRWNVNNNILSLVISNKSLPDSSGGTTYMVYNVDISSGQVLSAASLLQAVGFSEAKYYERAKQALASRCWSGWDPSNEAFANQSFVDFFNQQLENTISDSNIAKSYPYINEAGQLCIIAKRYSLAGADYYWCDVNLIDFVPTPYYEVESEKTMPAISISEDEAYQIACDYWNYSEGDVAEETGFELFLVYDGLMEESDGNHYYAFRLRWWVPENGMASTVDYVYINASTGECSYSI